MKGEIIRKYRGAYDDKGLSRWLTANAVIASLFAAALVAMAVFAAMAPTKFHSADRDENGQAVRQAKETQRPPPQVDDIVGAGRHDAHD